MPDSIFIPNDQGQLREASGAQIDFKNEFSGCNDVVCLYRGDSLDTFTRNYKLTTERAHQGMAEQLAYKMFMVGIKAKCYVGKRAAKEEANILQEIEDISDEVFVKIYKELCKTAFSRKLQKASDNKFVADNQNFLKSLEKMNYEKFVQKIKNFTPVDKSLVRDYYLALLHQLNRRPYKDQSALISTSTDVDQAVAFARGRDEENVEIVMLSYFIPQPFDTYAVGPYTIRSSFYQNFLQARELPIIEKEPYPFEKEYSVRRALFPHFILSFKIISFKGYGSCIEVLNPYLAKDDFLTVKREGFQVDQQSFFQVIQGTEYLRSGNFNGAQFRQNP